MSTNFQIVSLSIGILLRRILQRNSLIYSIYFHLLYQLRVHKHTQQSLCYPTNAHNVKNVELLKRIKIILEAAPTCFRIQRCHHQGATASI
jgi:uncharacterized ion transporter superfamily protein YfcC